MENSLLGFMELFIVFGFALGWGILEFVASRLDTKRDGGKSISASENPDARNSR